MFEAFPETPLFGANLVSHLFRADTREEGSEGLEVGAAPP